MKTRLQRKIRLAAAVAAIAAGAIQTLGATALSVTSPTTGQTLTAGTTVTITWQATEPNGYVDVELLRNGVPFTSIGYVPMADGQMDWEVCPIIGDSTSDAVRLVGRNAAGFVVAATSGVFSITGSAVQPTMAVTYPTAGVAWVAGASNSITWTSTDPVGCVYIDLYKGDQLYREIGYASMARGAFAWSPCRAIGDGTDYAIRLSTDGCGSSPTATSAVFSITGSLPVSLVLSQPAAGDEWIAGTTVPIQWAYTAYGAASIVLLKNGQWNAYLGLASLDASTFDWSIGCDMPTGTDYVLRAATCDDCGRVVSALSPAFSIRQRADLDWDGDADTADFGLFSCCYNGPNRPAHEWCGDCSRSDFDGDHDVDLIDFSVFRAAFNGSNQLPRCN